MKIQKDFKMKDGERLKRCSNNPMIGITGNGVNTYLGVGNDASNDKFCFATISGMKTLETFAWNILKSLGHVDNSIRKNIYAKNKN